MSLALLSTAPAFPQAYPSKPIRLIVLGPAGSVSDLRARWVAEKLNAALGQPIVVDNRAGAGGNIGAEDVTHVPYKGGTPALLDLMGGRLTYTFDALVLQAPHAKSGKIRGLAVTSTKRVAALPDVPTVAESGVPRYEYWGWVGLAAPAGTPRDIVARLNSEIVKILRTPEAREWFAEQGGEPVGDTPEEFAAYIKREHAKWGPIVREAGIKAD